jgi:hypothetical protein
MGGYPDGMTQADHDRAFGELEESGDRDRDYDPLDDIDDIDESEVA